MMRIPFGAELPEGDSVRPFLERSTVMRALFPGQFDLGARLQGRYRFLEGAFAVMNGSPLGDRVFPALAPTKAKDLVGRLGVRAEITSSIRLEMGVSAEAGTGFHKGTPTTKDQVVWRDDNGDGLVQATEIRVVPGASATPSEQFDRFAIGADSRVTIRFEPLGDFAIRAEIVRAKNLDRGIEYADPVGAGYDLRELGWYVAVTQELTDWALIGVRYDRYNPDQDANERRAVNVVPVDRTYSTWAFTAMLRYGKARLVAEFDKNGNALGRDASGAPTTLRSDAFTLRAQMVF